MMDALDEEFSREVLKVLREVAEMAEDILKRARMQPMTSKDFGRLTYGSFREFRSALMRFLKHGTQDEKLYKVMTVFSHLERAHGVHFKIPNIRVKKSEGWLWEEFNVLHMVEPYCDHSPFKWQWVSEENKVSDVYIRDMGVYTRTMWEKCGYA